MIDSSSLRAILRDIYGIDEKYLVPLDNGWYVPTYDKNDKMSTWIGYRILEIKPNLRGFQGQQGYSKSVKGRFRLAFVGKQAEQLALQTLAFDDRADVIDAFAKYQIQLNYVSREILTYPIKEGGLNDNLCWFTDIDCQSFYDLDIRPKDWNVEVSPEPEQWVKNVPRKSNRLESGTLIIKA